jgi:hypothetical protein
LKVKKDNGWTDEQLHQVEWSEYHRALRGIPRLHRVSIAKLSHQLWNTNYQNKKYYGTPATCTLCGNSPETPDHIYCCSHPAAVENRVQAVTTFRDTIVKKTPPSLLSALISILTGTSSDHIDANLTEIVAKKRGLGQLSICRGHVITNWLVAFKSYTFAMPKGITTSLKMLKRWATVLSLHFFAMKILGLHFVMPRSSGKQLYCLPKVPGKQHVLGSIPF